jgi:hypothetical protein
MATLPSGWTTKISKMKDKFVFYKMVLFAEINGSRWTAGVNPDVSSNCPFELR